MPSLKKSLTTEANNQTDVLVLKLLPVINEYILVIILTNVTQTINTTY